ncbi:hypothetical protein K449DRAFT_189545 [Hypoxylon sp. EC38]|nr:hypothetical protein K449DRAFT_189545 [Hypoxylon sp. EC38]
MYVLIYLFVTMSFVSILSQNYLRYTVRESLIVVHAEPDTRLWILLDRLRQTLKPSLYLVTLVQACIQIITEVFSRR